MTIGSTLTALNEASKLGDGVAVSAAMIQAATPVILDIVSQQPQLVNAQEKQQLIAALNQLEQKYAQTADAGAVRQANTLLRAAMNKFKDWMSFLVAAAVLVHLAGASSSLGLVVIAGVATRVLVGLIVLQMKVFDFIATIIANTLITVLASPILLFRFGVKSSLVPILNALFYYFKTYFR